MSVDRAVGFWQRRLARHHGLALRQKIAQSHARTRRGAHEFLRIGVRGRLEDGLRGCRFHHVAFLHHHDTVAVGRREAEIVGDEDGGHAARARQLHDQVHHGLLRGDVEAGGGLVSDQQLRPAGQRQRDDDALAHAARQLERIGVIALLRPCDAHLLEDGDGLLGLVVGAGLGVLAQHVLDLVPDLADRVQGRARVLKDHRDLAPAQVAHLALAGLAHVDAGKGHGTLGDAPGAVEDAHHRIGRDGLA